MKQFYLTIFLSVLFCISNLCKAQSELWGVNPMGADGLGSIYSLNTGATALTSQYNFQGVPGSNPQFTRFLQASNGKLYCMTNTGGATNQGVLFEFDTLTNAYVKKVDFMGTNGANPKGALIQAANGKIYGMTQLGGANALGVLFEYNVGTGVYNVLLNFSGTGGSFPGSQPMGALFQPNPGSPKLYGMTNLGGTNDKGVIFEYDYNTNTYTVKVHLDGNTGLSLGGNPVGQLVASSPTNNALYGLASTGGTNNSGVLFEYDYVTNTFTKKWDFQAGTGTGRSPQGSLLLASNGRLYGTTSLGGTSAGVLFEYIVATNTYSRLVNMVAGAGQPGGSPSGDLIEVGSGKLYGLARAGGASNTGVIFELDVTNPTAPVYTKKIDMIAGNGSVPAGSLMQASTGRLFGVTSAGGAVGGGVVFGYDVNSNTYAKRVDLNLSQGANPNGGLILANNGKLYGLAASGGTVNSLGVLYEYDRSTNVYTKKVDLSGNTGANPGSVPYGSLMQASNGRLYGITSAGGTNAAGTLFSYDISTNTYAKHVDLSNALGGVPYGSLAQFTGTGTANGKLYGMTKQGGASSQGVIFEFDPSTTTYTKKLDLSLASVNGYSAFGSMVESSNKFYGLTQLGGANNLGVIFEYDPNTNIYTKKIDLSGTAGAAPGSLPFGSLVETNTVGVLYGMTRTGGANDLGVIFEYNTLTNTYTKKYDMNGTNGGNPLGTLVRAANNKLYGVTNTGGTNSTGVLFEFDPATGVYTKKLDLTAATGHSPTYLRLLEICTMPQTPGVISASSASVCMGDGATRTLSIASVTNALSYAWTLPAGASILSGNGGTLITVDFSGTAAGNYTYGVAGVNVCGTGTSSTSNFLVEALPTINVNSGTACSGDVFTIVPGGAQTYTVQGNSFTVSPSPGVSTYTVRGTSAQGCVSSNFATSSLTVFTLPTISANNGTICAGQQFTIVPGGVVTSTPSGGSLIVSPTSNTFYTIVGRDANNCLSSNTATANVTVNPVPVISISDATICAGNSATLSPSGAGAGGTYTLNGVAGPGPFVVAPGSSVSYTVAGTTALNCVSSNTPNVSVTVNSLPVISVNNASICSGTSATLSPSGAGAGGTYTLNGSPGAGPFVLSPGSSITYTVAGTSAQGCLSSNTASSNVTVYTLPVIGVNNGTICSGQQFTLVPTGVVTFTASGGSSVVAPTTNTFYTVTGTDANNCVSANTATAYVTVNSVPVISISNASLCAGKSATLSPSGAGANGTYTLNGVAGPGPFVVSPSGSTSYTVAGTTSLNCVSSNTPNVAVTVHTLPVIAVANQTTCAGKSATITPSGAGAGGTYTVNGVPGSGSFPVLPSTTTTYTVAGTNSLGCVSANTASSTVTVYTVPVISVNSATLCAGKQHTFFPTGAVSYTMTGPVSGTSFPVQPSSSSSYTFAGTSADGCVSSQPAATANVTVYTLPVISATSGVICSGSVFTTTVNGAVSYTYASSSGNTVAAAGSTTLNPLSTTAYFVSGTSAFGCVSSVPASMNVTVNPLPVISATSGVICANDVFTTTVNGAASYTYIGTTTPSMTSAGSVTLSPGSTETFSVYGTSAAGCTSTLASILTITVNSLPAIVINTPTTAICEGETLTLTATGANTYTWNTVPVSTGSVLAVTPSVATTYTAFGTDLNGCSSSSLVMISVNVLPTITVAGGGICPGNCYTLSPLGAATYTFSDGNSVVCPTITTSYTVTGESTAGCISAPVVATVSVVNVLTVTVVGNTTICNGGTVNLTAGGASTYSWSSGDATSSVSLTPTSNITYTVVGSSGTCHDTLEVNVTVHQLPNITATAQRTLICENENVELYANGGISYNWSTSATGGTITVSPLTNTVYSVIGTDANNCTNTGTASVQVSQCLGLHNYSGTSWEFGLYPNPNAGEFVIETSQAAAITIHNPIGQVVLQQQLDKGRNQVELNGQAKGIYFVQVKSGDTTKIIKIVKQ